MKDILFMTVDLGTSFIKAGVYDTEGNCIISASEPLQKKAKKQVYKTARSLLESFLINENMVRSPFARIGRQMPVPL